jgi:hypothetical protein
VHLAAAGLGLAEFDRVSETLEHGYYGSTGLWEESVVVAGDEEGNVQGGFNTSLHDRDRASAERSLGAARTSARAT